VFSAAIPFQGGHHHVNEQFLSYWEALFAKHDFQLLDIFRGQIWHDQQILWWLRQNIVLVAHKDLIAGNERLRVAAAQGRTPISVVHPDVYVSRIRNLMAQIEQFKGLDAYLRQGGSFKTRIGPDGRLEVTRL